MAIDYEGIAVLLGALAGVGTAIGAGVGWFLTYQRQGKLLELQMEMMRKHSAQLNVIEEHVNGLNVKIERGAFAAGKAVGVQQERDNPMSPTKDHSP
jgi:hypothetical protein